MDSFDIKLFEIFSINILETEDVEAEVRNRIKKVLDHYFIFVPRDRYDPESYDSWQKPPYMYAVVNGKVQPVQYSSVENMYMWVNIKISWDKLYRTQNEAIDSIISKRRRKPL
jgi:hypothetical protein